MTTTQSFPTTDHFGQRLQCEKTSLYQEKFKSPTHFEKTTKATIAYN